MDGQTGGQKDGTLIQTHRQTDWQTYRWTNIQTDRQTDMQQRTDLHQSIYTGDTKRKLYEV